jgi:hypothetical protein
MSVMFFACREWRTGGHGGQGGGPRGHDKGIGGVRTWAVPRPAFSARFVEAVREKFFRTVSPSTRQRWNIPRIYRHRHGALM